MQMLEAKDCDDAAGAAAELPAAPNAMSSGAIPNSGDSCRNCNVQNETL